MALTIYVKIEDNIHRKVAGYLQEVDQSYGLQHRHSRAFNALQDHNILQTTQVFVCWLDEAKTMVGLRFPVDLQLAHLQFHAYNEATHIQFIDVEKQARFYRGLSVDQQQTDEIAIAANVKLIFASSQGYGGIPAYEIERLQSMPVRQFLQQQRIAEARERTQLGRMYLEHALQKAEEESFSVPYTNCTLIASESMLKLTLDKKGEFARQRQKIESCKQKGCAIDITRGSDEEKQKTICSGKIWSMNSGDAVLTLIVEKNGIKVPDEELKRLYHERILSKGNLTYSSRGDLPTQIRALQRLEHDETHMANLDLLLYGDNRILLLPPLPEAEPLPVEQCLNKDINEDQRRAVALALAAPDVFFMQGPPGTGKTTFIAELSYQLAKAGQKVLVSSQSNLAVDNALSRLERNPEILAIRLGQDEKVKQEESDFVGDRAVRRWIRSIASHSQERLDRLREAAALRTLFVDEWEAIGQKVAYITAWQEEKKRLMALQQYLQEEKKRASGLASTIQLLKRCEEEIKELEQQLTESKSPHETPMFWTQLRALLPQRDAPPAFGAENDPWTAAARLHRQCAKLNELLRMSEGELRASQGIFDETLRSRQQQQEIANVVQKVQASLQVQEQQQREIEDILRHQRISEEIGSVRYESATYTHLARRLERAQRLTEDSAESLLSPNAQRVELESAIHMWYLMETQGKSREAEHVLNQVAYELSYFRWESSMATVYLRVLLPHQRKINTAVYMLRERINFLVAVMHGFGYKDYKDYPLSYCLWQEYNQIWQRKVQEIEQTREACINKEQEALKQQHAHAALLKQAVPHLQRIQVIIGHIQTALDIRTTSRPDSPMQDPFLSAYEALRDLLGKLQAHKTSASSERSSLLRKVEQLYRWICSQCTSFMTQEELKYRQIQTQHREVTRLEQGIKARENEVQQMQRELQLKWRGVGETTVLSLVPLEEDMALTTQVWQRARRAWLDSIGGVWELENLNTMIRILEDWVKMVGESDQEGEISPDIWRLFLQSANVIGATCAHSGTAGFLRNFSEFDVVIVDEVSKATPTELLIPCLLAKKVILVGDHKQLPPVLGEEALGYIRHIASQVTSTPEESKIVEEDIKRHLFSSVFKDRFEYLSLQEERLHRTIMLTKQYRMHSDIMDTINQFYKGALKVGDSTINDKRQHGLQIPGWLPKQEHHVVWIDLPGEWKHRQVDKGRENIQEALLVIRLLHDIFSCWQDRTQPRIENFSIGVISMYRKQAERIRKGIRYEGRRALVRAEQEGWLTVGTVDEFQGMEKDIIVLSLVVNEPNVELSNFLCTAERINVAMSRARRLLVIVGSTHNYINVKSRASEMYQNVIDHCGYYIKANDTWLKKEKR